MESSQYSILYCDPPWNYDDKAQAGKRGAEFKYPCMTFMQLLDMSSYIESISKENSVLYMWSTAPMLPDALCLMGNWGFKYKTMGFVWIKSNKHPFDDWELVNIENPFDKRKVLMATITQESGIYTAGDAMGMGNHTRGNAEFCLLGIKGKGIKRVDCSVRQVVISPRREHSRKPAEVRTRIETLYGEQDRIELFSREAFSGWAQHGNEIDKFKSAERDIVV